MPSPNDTINSACVYLVLGTGPLCKIGYTSRLTQRLRAIQSQSPEPIRLLHKIPARSIAGAAGIEQLLHREFHHRRGRGEWFALTADDLARIISPPDGDPLAGVAGMAMADAISAPEAAGLLRVPLTRLRLLIRGGLLKDGPPFNRQDIEALASEMASMTEIGGAG